MKIPYNHRNCQSLFGYALNVHKRSGGICQFCSCNAGEQVDFDLWRQMSVEHIIGRIKGGDVKDVRVAITQRFPELSPTERERLVQRIDEANTVTACGFCNSMTSQHDKHGKRISDLLDGAKGTPDEIVDMILIEISKVFEEKRVDVRRKIEAVRAAFDRLVEPDLLKARVQ